MAYVTQNSTQHGMLTEVIDYSRMQSKGPQQLQEDHMENLGAYAKDDPYLKAMVEQMKRGITKKV